jgi:hypothetical protein
MFKKGLTILFVLFFPNLSFSQVFISEIMYDLSGSDTGREWIEISNEGVALDISLYKLFENETNHSLNLFRGSPILDKNSSLVIVDNPEKFLIDWPDFSGTIFDSSFSLKNTGEILILRDGELNDLDSVNFIPDWGALGDGNSLNKNGNSWTASVPTPGSYLFTQSTNETSSSTTVSNTNPTPYKPPVNFPVGTITTKIISDKNLLVGADNLFEAKSLGVEGKPLINARHLWNFGDGGVREGERVMYHYSQPGEYIVFLDTTSESFTASDKIYLTVYPSNVVIKEANKDFIKIRNESNKDINLSFWILESEGKFFILPKNTYVKQNGEISISSSNSELNGDTRPIKLLYPNGSLANKIDSFETVLLGASKVKEKTQSVIRDVEEKINDGNTASALSTISTDNKIKIEEETGKKEYGGLLNKWTLVFVGLLALSALSIVFVRKNETVEGFTIIE